MPKRDMIGARAGFQPRGAIMVRQVEGQASLEIGLNYEAMGVPDHSYYADYCDVQEARAGYSLFFGKLMPGMSKLRTKVEVAFPRALFHLQLWASSREFHELVSAEAGKIQLQPVENVEDTDKVQTFRSNFVFMGMWGEDSVMDFYYVSPRAMHYAKLNRPAQEGVEPVIRIAMGTALIFEFLEKCKVFAESPASAILQEGR